MYFVIEINDMNVLPAKTRLLMKNIAKNEQGYPNQKEALCYGRHLCEKVN